MEITLAVVFAVLGAVIGSFLNVCIDRLPAGRSLAFPPSHCDACQRRLSPPDLVPVLSYIWLRGRCQYCGARIPYRSLWIEIGNAALFVFLYWHYGISVELAVTAVYCSLFLVLLGIDLEHGLILNKIVYPAALVVIVLNAPFIDNLLHQPGIVKGLVGGGTGLVFFLIPAVINPRGMGMGDVKMAALIGLVTGFPQVLVALVMGVVAGGLVAAALLLFKIKKRKETIPFGPFLSLATIVTLLWGNDILQWYMAFYQS